MALHYHCRHCGVKVGTLQQSAVHSEELGLHQLSPQERQEMVSYSDDGHIHIQTICEDCQEALERNPDLHQHEKFIH
ncbi:DUF2757 family protein [Bacillus lacus]|uniref:DUF2757 family protein n=1 Tax=Metabacillus lacus TaxID=1983721 RepID=A0A7X2J1I4_9BACI|nr:anti-sigma-F factor Fin family protein [Metabacillus lacus]MRX72958.1 DUF2757 family protein [Metabacillus lacus]